MKPTTTSPHDAQPARLLSKAEAEAIYSAMCALNNVGGRLKVNLKTLRPKGDPLHGYEVQLQSHNDESIYIEASHPSQSSWVKNREGWYPHFDEAYTNQHDFAEKHGLGST